MLGRRVILAVVWFGLLCVGAAAEKRVALIIGNGSYEDAGTLANPVNDALDIAAKLKSIGFVVVEGHDLGKRDLERKIGEFSDQLGGASVGLFFYAGHGLQVDGRNFIIPVDARLDVPAKLKLEAVPIDDIIDIIELSAETSIVFLDACRNNPFTRGLTPGKRSAASLGLAQFSSTRGSFIAFATAPGQVALDGSGRNSPFTKALLSHIDLPGQSINDLMIAVRRDVIAQTGDQQRPWEQGSLTERFEFVPDGKAVVAAPKSEQPRPVEQPAVQMAERSVGDAASVERFLRDAYLMPDSRSIEDSVRAIYANPATSYGAMVDIETMVKVKSDWFSQWSGWSLALVPGTLTVTPGGADRASVAFDMSYDYVPKAKGAARAAGKARVTLGLVARDGGWLVETESSALAQ